MNLYSEPMHIQPSQVIDLRHRVLRPDQDISVCTFTGDELATSFHLGIFELKSSKVVCNGTFMQEDHFELAQLKPNTLSVPFISYRLRGMATDPAHRKQQLGAKLLRHGELLLKEKNCSLLWFNAREVAFEFYKKLGYQFYGELFDIATVGPHKVMYKWL